MNILFLDDTEQLNKEYVGVGGVIFHDDYLCNLFNVFLQKKERHGIPPEEEIKWSPDRDSWIAKNLRDDSRVSAYSDILDLVRLFKGRLIVAVVRRIEIQSSIEAKWQCIEFVTERFQFYLQSNEDRKGLIISDFPGSGKEEKRLLQDYYQLLEKGTKYVKPANIVMNLLTTESYLNPSLQIADLVVGITTSMCTPRNRFALDYWDLIKNHFHRSQNGEIIGCGLKVFPSEIVGDINRELFQEEFVQASSYEESHAERVERIRRLYSVLMSEEELNMHFPRPH